MDDPPGPERAAPQAEVDVQSPAPEREDLAAKLDDLGKRLILDEHQYWQLPEGWTESGVRDLAAKMGLPIDIMAHHAVISALGALPSSRSPLDAGIPRFDFEAVQGRHALRRLNESANRRSSADSLFMLKCQGRGCRRRLGQVVTRPRGSAVTPDGVIEPDWITEGPVLSIFGPFERGARRAPGEYPLRGTKESVAAPTQDITLRGHKIRADGTFDPAEVPLGPGERIAILCGCGHQNVVSLSTLSTMAEVARAASNAALNGPPRESEPNRTTQ